MSEYLSKEEIRQWRSSLEKVTLEEFAARLGKKIVHESADSGDLIDTIFHGHPTVVSQDDTDWRSSKSERLNSIAERAFARERQISSTPFSAESLKSALSKSMKSEKETVKKSAKTAESKKVSSVKSTEVTKVKDEKKITKNNVKSASKSVKASEKKVSTLKKTADKKVNSSVKSSISKASSNLREEVRIVLKKALTDREQKVFDYFSNNSNKIVYAKDLASLLDLPRDYVYKYIKNLRAKIDGDNLKNADKGGFILSF